MAIAVVSVSLLILFMLGWRESGVVAVAIPSTLALTLLVFYLVGYTLNRITLFALIFSIGILVDDAIVVVENIVRVRDLPENRGKPLAKIAVEAVAEVGNPTVLATLAVIAAILPMAFVGGLMGPYMRPIPVGATAAMIFSLLVAFIVTPWAAVRILRPNDGKGHGGGHGHDAHGGDDRMTRAYRWLVSRLVTRTAWRWSFLVTIVVLLLGAIAFIPAELVKVKMLPFDNKSEFQIVINMPEGSSLERTAQAVILKGSLGYGGGRGEESLHQPGSLGAESQVGDRRKRTKRRRRAVLGLAEHPHRGGRPLREGAVTLGLFTAEQPGEGIDRLLEGVPEGQAGAIVTGSEEELVPLVEAKPELRLEFEVVGHAAAADAAVFVGAELQPVAGGLVLGVDAATGRMR